MKPPRAISNHLADTAHTLLVDLVTILLGLTVSAFTQTDIFITAQLILIFIPCAISIVVATAGRVFSAKVMNISS